MAGSSTQVLYSSNNDYGILTRPMQRDAKLFQEVTRVMHRFGTHFPVRPKRSGVNIPFVGPIVASAMDEETGYTEAQLPSITNREFTPATFGVMTRITEEAELTFEGNWGRTIAKLQAGSMSRLEDQMASDIFGLPSNNVGAFNDSLNALALVQADTWIKENWKPTNIFGTPDAGESCNAVLTMTAINELVGATSGVGNSPMGVLMTTQQSIPQQITDSVLKKWWSNTLQYTGTNIFRGANIQIHAGTGAAPAGTAMAGITGKSYSTGGVLTKMGMAFVTHGDTRSTMRDDAYTDDKIWRMRKRFGFHKYIDKFLVGLKTQGLGPPAETTS